MTDHDTDETSTPIHPREAAALRAQAAAMPYGVTAHHHLFAEDRRIGNTIPPLEVEDVVLYLAALRESLVSASERADKNERELFQHRSDLAAFRRVIGGPTYGGAL